MHTTDMHEHFQSKGSNICARHHINGIRNLFLCYLCLMLVCFEKRHTLIGECGRKTSIGIRAKVSGEGSFTYTGNRKTLLHRIMHKRLGSSWIKEDTESVCWCPL